MNKSTTRFTLAAAGVLALAACAGMPKGPSMSFFVTSADGGKGADFGGLDGADRFCQRLASAVGAGGRTGAPTLSASAEGGKPAVNARDRIGTGPWYNAKDS